jgi:hypothetical protein
LCSNLVFGLVPYELDDLSLETFDIKLPHLGVQFGLKFWEKSEFFQWEGRIGERHGVGSDD